MTKISVLGAGSWGSVLASMLADNGHEVALYAHRQVIADEINQDHTNLHYMKDWTLNPSVWASTDMGQVLKDCDVILFDVPTSAIRSVAKAVRQVLDENGRQPYLVSATKGIEPGTKKLVLQIFKDEIYPDGFDKMIVLSGPSHAENTAQKDLTAITLASTSLDNAAKMQKIFLMTMSASTPATTQSGSRSAGLLKTSSPSRLGSWRAWATGTMPRQP